MVTRERLIFFVDDCHVRYGDAVGYVWGPVGQRVSLPIGNVQERQTYDGALNLLSGRALTWPAPCGNREQTVLLLKR